MLVGSNAISEQVSKDLLQNGELSAECCSDMTHYNTKEGAAYMGGKVLSVICSLLGISAAEVKVEDFSLEKYSADNIGY